MLGRSVGSGKGSEWDFLFLPSEEEEEEEEGRDYETEANKVYREEQKSTHQNEAFFPSRPYSWKKGYFLDFFVRKRLTTFFRAGKKVNQSRSGEKEE